MRRAPCPRGCFGQRAAEPGAVWRLAQSRVPAPGARQARKGRVGAMLEAKPPPSAAPGFPQPAPGFPHPSPPAFSSVLKHSALPPTPFGPARNLPRPRSASCGMPERFPSFLPACRGAAFVPPPTPPPSPPPPSPHQQALHVDRRARVADHGLQLPLAALEHPRRRLGEGGRRHLRRLLLLLLLGLRLRLLLAHPAGARPAAAGRLPSRCRGGGRGGGGDAEGSLRGLARRGWAAPRPPGHEGSREGKGKEGKGME